MVIVALPRLELGLSEPKSDVLTTTPKGKFGCAYRTYRWSAVPIAHTAFLAKPHDSAECRLHPCKLGLLLLDVLP